MEETKVTTEEVIAPETVVAPVEAAAVATPAPKGEREDRRPRGKSPRSPRAKFVREKPEFDSKMLSIRRVTRVVSGGRRFALSVAIAAGDRNGRIGLGTGKAQDTQMAIEKAMKQAKRNMITLRLNKAKSLPHDIEAKYKSAKVTLMPNRGKGLIAGSSARIILNLAGVKDATVKFHSGTKNKLNNARATMKALEEVAYAHGEAPVQAAKMEQAPVKETN
jgi:small subunit ribosomal protein S5